MNKFLLFVLTMCLLASCKKSQEIAEESQVQKSIFFELFTEKDYSDSFYENAFAEVHLQISKTNIQTNQSSMVWDTTYSFRNFSQYPQIEQKIALQKQVQLYDSKEQLTVGSVVRYKFNGYISMEARSEDWYKGSNSKTFTVSF